MKTRPPAMTGVECVSVPSSAAHLRFGSGLGIERVGQPAFGIDQVARPGLSPLRLIMCAQHEERGQEGAPQRGHPSGAAGWRCGSHKVNQAHVVCDATGRGLAWALAKASLPALRVRGGGPSSTLDNGASSRALSRANLGFRANWPPRRIIAAPASSSTRTTNGTCRPSEGSAAGCASDRETQGQFMKWSGDGPSPANPVFAGVGWGRAVPAPAFSPS